MLGAVVAFDWLEGEEEGGVVEWFDLLEDVEGVASGPVDSFDWLGEVVRVRPVDLSVKI